jgi:hypothetical protein
MVSDWFIGGGEWDRRQRYVHGWVATAEGHGDDAAAYVEPDTRDSLIGYATHHGSAVFWALLLTVWLASRPRRSSVEILRDASIISAMAATVDYGITPKRLTPGWELVLSRRSMFAAFAALAIGLALGARITQDLLDQR